MSEFSTIELSTSDRPTRFQVDPVEYRHKQPESDAEIDEDDTFPENEDITSKRRSSRWMSDVNIINALQKKKKKRQNFIIRKIFLIIKSSLAMHVQFYYSLILFCLHILNTFYRWWGDGWNWKYKAKMQNAGFVRSFHVQSPV